MSITKIRESVLSSPAMSNPDPTPEQRAREYAIDGDEAADSIRAAWLAGWHARGAAALAELTEEEASHLADELATKLCDVIRTSATAGATGSGIYFSSDMASACGDIIAGFLERDGPDFLVSAIRRLRTPEGERK
jgi:hypothetical protein